MLESLQMILIAAAGIIIIILLIYLRNTFLKMHSSPKTGGVDPLTGFYAFTYMERLGKRMLASGGRVICVFIDFDNFKMINDTYGHRMGNQALLYFSAVMQKFRLKHTFISRLGGDEFVILFDQKFFHIADVESIMYDLREKLNAFQNGKIPIPFSYGISVQNRKGNTDIQKLVHEADKQMYYYKHLDNEQVFLYHPERSIPPLLQNLLDAMKEKDIYTYVHLQAAAQYSAFLSGEISDDDEFIWNMYLAGLLHDIGKIVLPNKILRKPGKLDIREKELMKEHVENGLNVLRIFPVNTVIKNAISAHHERYDGKGYPAHLSGKRIPLEGRIMSIANTYARFTVKNLQKEKKSAQQGMIYLQEQAGSVFDPKLVDIFVSSLQQTRKR